MEEPVSVFIFDKVTGLRPATLIKKRLRHWCFPKNLVIFLKHFFYRTSLVGASQANASSSLKVDVNAACWYKLLSCHSKIQGDWIGRNALFVIFCYVTFTMNPVEILLFLTVQAILLLTYGFRTPSGCIEM